ncbi:MAG: hypothetical protein JNJ53_10905 [Rhizobiales bacterium]|nr:hypothetical protein [Hyphomicrobiales bacterium]
MFARSVTLALAAFAIVVTFLVWRNDARSSNLGALIAMCSANPACSQSQPDETGAVTFRIRQQDAMLRLACSSDGACLRVEPKAARVSVVNAGQMISPR